MIDNEDDIIIESDSDLKSGDTYTEEKEEGEEAPSSVNLVLNSTDTTHDKLKESSDKAIQEYAEIGIQGVQDKFKSGDLDGAEAGKEVAHVIVTAKALEDTKDNEEFNKEFKNVKQEELIQSAKKKLYEEQAKKIAAKQVKAEAFYTSFRPILEFDLDHLLVKNPPKKVKYTKVYDKELGKFKKVPAEQQEESIPIGEKAKHTYSERSYGIPLMVLMLIILTIPYFLATIALSIFAVINYIFVAISRFTKPAFYICAGIAGVAILGLFIYVILLCIQLAFNIQIIPI